MSNPSTCACEEHTHTVGEKVDGAHVLVCTECGAEHRVPCPLVKGGQGRDLDEELGWTDLLLLVGLLGAIGALAYFTLAGAGLLP